MPSISLAADSMPPAFTATYQLNKFGLNAAQAKIMLQRSENGTWIYKSQTHTKGLVALFRDDEIIESTTLRVEGQMIKPILYVYQHKGSKKNRDQRINFDWNNLQAKSMVSGHPSRIRILNNTVDNFSLQLQMMMDLSGKGLADSYSILKKGELEEYRFQQFDEELIPTPAGDFQAIRLLRERENSKRKTIMWTAGELHHLPIKITHIEDDGTEFTLLLSNIQGLNQQQND
jgi:hypothetical protein